MVGARLTCSVARARGELAVENRPRAPLLEHCEGIAVLLGGCVQSQDPGAGRGRLRRRRGEAPVVLLHRGDRDGETAALTSLL